MSATSRPSFDSCFFWMNSAFNEGGALYVEGNSRPSLTSCTMTFNSASSGSSFFCRTGGDPLVENCLIAWGRSGAAFDHDAATGITFSCCDIYGNVGGDWVNGIERQLGVDGNISRDPLLCSPGASVGTVATDSPCRAENNPTCGRIGRYGEGCDAPTYTIFASGSGMLPTIQAAIDYAPEGSKLDLHGDFTGPENRNLDTGGKNLRFFGQAGATIDCEGSGRAFHFHSGETAETRVSRLRILNGTAQSGGGILIENGSSPTLQLNTIESCHGSSGPGIAILGASSNPEIYDCTLRGNSGSNGGGMYVGDGAQPSIHDCEFEMNSGYFGGGLNLSTTAGVVLRDCSFVGNSAWPEDGGQGGAIWTTDGHNIRACVFSGNWAEDGAAIYAQGNLNQMTQVDSCSFEDNQTGTFGRGGGIHANGPQTLTATRPVFANNTAREGGTLFLQGGAQFELFDGRWETNAATNAGGAIYQAPSAGFLQIEGCIFDSNEATGTGAQGAGLWLGGESHLAGTSLEWNTIASDGQGGGIYAAIGADVGLETCDLRQNAAPSGGGIYGTQAVVTMDACELLSNHATYGAAVYLNEDAGSSFTVSTFYDNSAAHTGGALLCDTESLPTVQTCSFVSNRADVEGAHLVCWNASSPQLYNSILAFAPAGEAVGIGTGGGEPSFHCSDIYGNAGGDWVGEIAGQLGQHNNFTADPLFCDLPAGDLTLYDTSPCLPANNPCGELVGAHGQGCEEVSDSPEPALQISSLELSVPNPFDPLRSLRFALPEPASVMLLVYDVSGRQVRTLLDRADYGTGCHEARWDGRDEHGRRVESGVYLFHLMAGPNHAKGRAVIIR